MMGGQHLIIPYTLDNNDMRFAAAQGFNSGDQFYTYLKDSFDTLYEEGGRMMNVGLHCRVVGKPGRAASLARFLEYVSLKSDIWFAAALISLITGISITGGNNKFQNQRHQRAGRDRKLKQYDDLGGQVRHLIYIH